MLEFIEKVVYKSHSVYPDLIIIIIVVILIIIVAVVIVVVISSPSSSLLLSLRSHHRHRCHYGKSVYMPVKWHIQTDIINFCSQVSDIHIDKGLVNHTFLFAEEFRQCVGWCVANLVKYLYLFLLIIYTQKLTGFIFSFHQQLSKNWISEPQKSQCHYINVACIVF